MPLRLQTFFVALSFWTFKVAADPAKCDSGWNWASNAQGQNPCAVAGNLDASCRSLDSYDYTTLENGYTYNVPDSSDAESLTCECNTVIFNLVMACTACQNESVDSWSTWTQHCNTVYVSQFPSDIPAGTGVPHWAYLNTTGPGDWSSADAKAAGDTPESSRPPQLTATVPTNTNTGPSTIGQGSNTNTNTPNPSNTNNPTDQNAQTKSKTNVGAIAGGVVGGVVILALVAGGVTYWMKNKKPTNPLSESAAYASPPTSPPPHMKLYNPDDPSSFPPAASAPSVPSQTTNGSFVGTTLQPQRGYTGHAEV